MDLEKLKEDCMNEKYIDPETCLQLIKTIEHQRIHIEFIENKSLRSDAIKIERYEKALREIAAEEGTPHAMIALNALNRK